MSRVACKRSFLLLTIMAGLVWPLSAQTPPVPNFGLTLRPELGLNVWPADVNREGRTDFVAATGPFSFLSAVVGVGGALTIGRYVGGRYAIWSSTGGESECHHQRRQDRVGGTIGKCDDTERDEDA